MLFKIIGIGVCGIVINLVLKQYKPEFAILANVCVGLTIFMLVVDGAGQLIENFAYLQNMTGVKVEVVSPILKVIGVGYITEFMSDLAEDSGNKSIANKIVMGGKIAICLLAIPIIKNLISAIISLV